jgi:hypothetical protein
VLVVLRFAQPATDAVSADGASADGSGEFSALGHAALDALAARPGYVSGQWCRAYDDPTAWCLVTQWESVGAYRRALSAHDVRVRATALLSRAVPEASAFEPLASAEPGGPVVVRGSDRADGGAHTPNTTGAGPIRSRA